MKWRSKDEVPNIFMDIVVCEPGGQTYAQQIDFQNTEVRGNWMYVGDMVRETVRLEDLLRTLLYELNQEASSSEDYGTRKHMKLLCEMIKLKLYGDKNDASN